MNPQHSVRSSSMSDAEEEVLKNLRRVIRAVDLYSRRLVNQTGLSSPQLICLRQLATHGAMQSGHLAAAVNLSAPTVCGILDRLESRGLVSRQRQRDDKRCVLVDLTPEGHHAVANAPPIMHDSFLFMYRTLPESQRAQINLTLKQLVSMMSADDLDAAPILVPGDSVTPGPADRGA
jgi:DNA-binding MarR family transcriptional regulator